MVCTGASASPNKLILAKGFAITRDNPGQAKAQSAWARRAVPQRGSRLSQGFTRGFNPGYRRPGAIRPEGAADRTY